MEYIKNKNGKIPVIRWGEVCLLPVTKLPKGLKKAKTDVVMTGSSNNPHIVRNCDVYFKKESDYIFGYLKANKGNKFFHREHGKGKGTMKEFSVKGKYYQLLVQNEATHEGLKVVID